MRPSIAESRLASISRRSWKQTLKAGLISAAGAGDLVVWFLLGETKPAKYAEPNYAE